MCYSQVGFFYIIKHNPSNLYYAGSKYGKDSDLSTFMTESGYKTSSLKVQELIRTYGLDSFNVVKIRSFNEPKKAYEYETKFLKKVDAKNNSRFLNMHNNDILGFGTDGFYFIMEKKYGVKYALQNDKILAKSKQTCLDKFGTEWYFQSEEHLSKQIEYSSLGGKVQGKINAENGHMIKIRNLVDENKRIERVKENLKNNKTGCFLDIELHKRVASLGGKVQGKINAENGHMIKISKKYWEKVNNGEITRKHYMWINNGIEEIQIEKDTIIPDNYVAGRLTSSEKYYWYNNGIIRRRFKENDIIPDGFNKGWKLNEK